MCNVSAVGDQFSDMWRLRFQGISPLQPSLQPSLQWPPMQGLVPSISRQEFDELRREVAEMKLLLKEAKAKDEQAGEPECQHEDKLTILRKMAELVGINLDDVLGKQPAP